MVYAIKLKNNIRRDLERDIRDHGEINMFHFIAAEELNTGLSSSTITQIIKNMKITGLITIEDEVIKKKVEE